MIVQNNMVKNLSITREKYGKTVMNIIMLVFSMKVVYDIIKRGFYIISSNESFYPHEFYINYQGGFVRRGLLGEILFQICKNLNINPQWVIAIFCLLCFVFVICFFVYLFKKNDILWWILPLSIFLGNDDIIRKDYFFIVSLILILLTYRSRIPLWTKIVIINILAIFTILSHEAFFFVCVPLLSLIIIRDTDSIKKTSLRIIACLPMFIAMAITMVFHGDLNTAQHIQQSWLGIIPDWSPTLIYSEGIDNYYGSIGSLAWTTDFAFDFHTKINFIYTSLRIPGYILRPIFILLLVYFTFSYITFFSSDRISSNTNIFLCIFLFLLISLLPLFTVLSCDTRRICFYWLTSSFAFFLMIPEDKQILLFPDWFVKFALNLRNTLSSKRQYHKAIVILLIFVIGAPYGGNNIRDAFSTSVIMKYYSIIQISDSLLF